MLTTVPAPAGLESVQALPSRVLTTAINAFARSTSSDSHPNEFVSYEAAITAAKEPFELSNRRTRLICHRWVT